MKKSFMAAGFSLALLLSTHGNAQQQTTPNFALLNETGHVITALYITPHSDPNWGPNILSVALDNDQMTNVTWTTATACLYDLKMALDNGEPWQIVDVNLCRITQIEVDSNRTYVVTHLPSFYSSAFFHGISAGY